MKNKMTDLRDHMFAQLERLSNEELSKEQLTNEIERAKAISDIGKVIVESAKTQVLYAKLTQQKAENPDKFLENKTEDVDEKPVLKIERPPAEYSNKSPYGIASGGS
jgi:hypothetical protein